MDPYKIIKFPLNTEKSVRLMESKNELIFQVDLKATKKQIKQAIEELFKVNVVKVNTLVSPAAKKRAYVRFGPETPAIDIATKMGMM